MTSQRQTDANRRNSLVSTGPKTDIGKKRSRCNAYGHGLTAETVVAGVEDAADYRTFEADIMAEYDPKSVIERELTRRLASLLWRLRRASLIETGLLNLQAEQWNDETVRKANGRLFARARQWGSQLTQFNHSNKPQENCHEHQHNNRSNNADSVVDSHARSDQTKQQTITHSFLRLADLASQPLERVNRYEATLWRQFVQVLFSLDQAKYHRIAAPRGRFTPHPPQW